MMNYRTEDELQNRQTSKWQSKKKVSVVKLEDFFFLNMDLHVLIYFQ